MRKPVVPHMNNPPEALVECDASLRFFCLLSRASVTFQRAAATKPIYSETLRCWQTLGPLAAVGGDQIVWLTHGFAIFCLSPE